MIIKLTEEEQKNLKIEHIQPKPHSSDYIKERDEHWNAYLEKAEKAGKKFWNGILYSVEGFDQTSLNDPVIYFGEMFYSDRLIKKKYTTHQRRERFGPGYDLIHCGVGIILVTTDKKFLVGITGVTTSLKNGSLSFVGGNLNKDEVEVNNMEDLYKSAIHELEEETTIKVDRDRLFFHSINSYKSYYDFTFVYLLPYDSSDNSDVAKNDEFKRFEPLSYEEILHDDRDCVTDFEYGKNYLPDILDYAEKVS